MSSNILKFNIEFKSLYNLVALNKKNMDDEYIFNVDHEDIWI